jgi:pyruvate dehydrogenase E1 component alpha subunit
MGTDFKRVSSVHDLSVMGASYDIPGTQVDGMNVLSVYEAVRTAVARARKDGSASFLEIKTYRYKGHSMSDPAKYRTKEELEEYRRQDPLLILEDAILTSYAGLEDELTSIDGECRKLVDASIEFAENSPEPELETMYEDIYV